MDGFTNFRSILLLGVVSRVECFFCFVVFRVVVVRLFSILSNPIGTHHPSPPYHLLACNPRFQMVPVPSQTLNAHIVVHSLLDALHFWDAQQQHTYCATAFGVRRCEFQEKSQLEQKQNTRQSTQKIGTVLNRETHTRTYEKQQMNEEIIANTKLFRAMSTGHWYATHSR